MRQFRDLPIRRKLVITGLVTSASALLLTTTIFVISAYFIGRRNTLTGLQLEAIAAVWGAIVGPLTAALIAARLHRQIADPILSPLPRTLARMPAAGLTKRDFHGFVAKPYQFAALSLSVARAAGSKTLRRAPG